MTGGILAAGRGERLRGCAELKPLVEIGGRPLIAHVLNAFAEIDVDEVAIMINEASEEIRSVVEQHRWPFALRWIVKTTPSSMHSFLHLIETMVEAGALGPFVISTVDTVITPGTLAAFCDLASGHQSAACLAVNEPADDDNPLWVRTDSDGNVISLGDNARSGLATAGLYVVRPNVLAEAESARRDGLMSLRSFLGRLLERGYALATVRISNSVDVDREADIVAAENFLQQK